LSYRHVLSVCALVVATGACGPHAQTSPPARRSDRNLITREEIAQRSFDNMHSVVSSLRSDWLRRPLSGSSVGATSAAPATIFLDGRLIGDLDILKSFSAESVERVRYYTVTEAQNRFGMTATTPVIELISRGRTP
jgi:hypothetical protein